MARKLCSIQKIYNIRDIPGADKIQVANVLGWTVVVEKNKFKDQDKVIYCEVDSILPEEPEYEFLRPRHFRIRTIRLRQTISQGICFPLSLLEGKKYPDDTRDNPIYEFDEGRDVTPLLGVKLYQPPIPAQIAGLVKGPFPSFLSRTDETRVQVLQDVLTRYKGTPCFITEKLDGSSVSYFLRSGEFGVCSRNLELKETEDNALWKWARENKVEEKLRSVGKDMAIQGEFFGHGIQKNPLEIEGNKVLFFNAFDIQAYKYLDYLDFISFFAKIELETVPLIATEFDLEDNIDFLVKIATKKSQLNPKKWAEGIVIRPLKEITDMQMATGFGNGRVSFKCLNPEYLLAGGE